MFTGGIMREGKVQNRKILWYNTFNNTIKDTFMTISANEVKIKGVSVFEQMFEKFSEVIINVRGKNKYCVIPFNEYEEFRAYKLDKAYKEAIEDINENKYNTDMEQHFKDIEEDISND